MINKVAVILRFAFTGKNTLGFCVVLGISSHRVWATKQLKSGLKSKYPSIILHK
ncbi:hypothetical protein [Helicobacter sp. T3_23-1056]